MRFVTIKHAMLTVGGTELTFDCFPLTVWAYVPGTTRRKHDQTGRSTLYFAGQYDIPEIVAVLRRSPLIKPNVELLDTPILVENTKAYLVKNYWQQGRNFLPQRCRESKTFPTSYVLPTKT